MHDAIIAMISFLFIAFVWYFCLRPSFLDDCRDRLFDLRDETRKYFIDHNLPLDSEDYRHLRDALNLHLRFTKRANLLSFFCWVATNPEMKVRNAYSFTKEVEHFGNDIRLRAARVMVDYMVYSSTTMMLILSFIVAPLCGVWLMLYMAWRIGLAIVRGSKLKLSAAYTRLVLKTKLLLFGRMYNVRQIESYSSQGVLHC